MNAPDVSVVPAEGRDYLTERCARTDWVLNLRFRVQSVASDIPALLIGANVTLEGARRHGLRVIEIIFRRSKRRCLVGTGIMGAILDDEEDY